MTGLALAAALAAVSVRAAVAGAGGRTDRRRHRGALHLPPSEIKVAVGTTLTVVLKSDDTTHGFRIKGEDVNVQIPKRGRGTVTATFTPAKAGTLHVRVLARLRRRPRLHARHDRRRRAARARRNDARCRAPLVLLLGRWSSPATGVARRADARAAARRSAARHHRRRVRGVPPRSRRLPRGRDRRGRARARPSTARAAPRATSCRRSAA